MVVVTPLSTSWEQYRAFLAAVRSSELIIFCMASPLCQLGTQKLWVALVPPRIMSKSVVVVSPCGSTYFFVHACMHHWDAYYVHATSAGYGRVLEVIFCLVLLLCQIHAEIASVFVCGPRAGPSVGVSMQFCWVIL
jgi:hypothetical protein